MDHEHGNEDEQHEQQPAQDERAHEHQEQAQEREHQDAGFVVNDRRFWNLSEEELEQEDEPPGTPTYIQQLEQQLEQKDQQLRDYIKAYKSQEGDGLEKAKQRLERDAELRIGRLRGELALPMLDVLEALERSVMAAQSTGNPEALMQGVQLTYQLMVQKLQEMGLSRIDCQGQPFDPAVHEAVAVAAVSDPAEDNLVVQEFRPGFALGEKVIRAAQVQVGKLQ